MGWYSRVSRNISEIPAAIQYPIGKESEFIGVVDLVSMKALIWEEEKSLGETFTEVCVPEEIKEECGIAREELIEVLADFDDDLAQLGEALEDRFEFEDQPQYEEFRVYKRRIGVHYKTFWQRNGPI